MRVPVSVFIIARNEADRIHRTIEAVSGWVDEVIVVVGSSSDNTIEVAEKAGARVVENLWTGFGQQKRFGESQCRNDWILNIDADEVVTDELRREIVKLFERGMPDRVAYGMPVELVYPGKVKPRRWAHDHWCVRLYDKRVVRFRNSALFDSVVTESHEVGSLKGAMYHYSIRSFDDMKCKLLERVDLAVEGSRQRSAAVLTLRLASELPMTFLKFYIGRRHITGGLTGLRYAAILARFRFMRVYGLWAKAMATPVPQTVAGRLYQPTV
ncbi:MAG: glycosyltransferase family 2 protein [Hyphomicrobium sp.]